MGFDVGDLDAAGKVRSTVIRQERRRRWANRVWVAAIVVLFVLVVTSAIVAIFRPAPTYHERTTCMTTGRTTVCETR